MTVAAASPERGPRRSLPMRWRGTAAAAVVVTLVRPDAWVVALAGFLARGGVVLVALPILVLPTPTGLQNALGGPVSSFLFGTVSPALVWLIVGATLAAVTLLLLGTVVGAWAERTGIAIALEAAADEGLPAWPAGLEGAPGAWTIAVVRLLGLAPLAVALLLAWPPVYDAVYRELILPDDLSTPLPVRVLADVPWPVIGIVVAWLLGDAAASVGVRRLVLERRPLLVAWLLGWIDLVRRPLTVLGTALFGAAVLVALVGPPLVIAAIGAARVREVMSLGRDPFAILITIALWVAMWLGGLVLDGVAGAVRNAAWTLGLPRHG